MTATSGGNVAKAEIRGIEGGGGFKVQFNPTNFQFDKQVQWKEHEEQGQEATLEFQKNSPANLSFELTFDTTGSDSDVRGAWVEPLLNLTKPEFTPQDGVASGLDKKRPPKVSFTWGEFVFLGVIENVSVTYIMFSPKGYPVRAKVQVKMKEWNEPTTSVGGGANINGGNNAVMVTLNAGQTISSVAQQNNSDMRAICEANNINDPLNAPVGMQIAIPR